LRERVEPGGIVELVEGVQIVFRRIVVISDAVSPDVIVITRESVEPISVVVLVERVEVVFRRVVVIANVVRRSKSS
jgi:hypothetical protein